jgi:hypothetical protein
MGPLLNKKLVHCLRKIKRVHNPAHLAYIMATAEHDTMNFNFKTMREVGGQSSEW